MGAATFVIAADGGADVQGNKRIVRGVLTLSNSYATSGDTIPLASVGLNQIDDMVVDAGTDVTAETHSLVLAGTPSAPKAEAYDQGVEETATTDLTGLAVPVRLYGT